jgi:hypothetical protein
MVVESRGIAQHPAGGEEKGVADELSCELVSEATSICPIGQIDVASGSVHLPGAGNFGA